MIESPSTEMNRTPGAPPPAPRSARGVPEAVQQQIKSAVHKELIKRLDLERLDEFNKTRSGQQQLFTVIQQLLVEQGIPPLRHGSATSSRRKWSTKSSASVPWSLC